MRLRSLSNDDLWLYEAIHCDLAMMEHVGGPLPREGLAEKLVRDVTSVEADRSWVLVIIPDEDPSTAAGTVAVWEHVMDDETVNEIGWMVLPAFQGRGLGSQAVRSVLERARAEGRWSPLHAFPPVTNARSNAMCRKMGSPGSSRGTSPSATGSCDATTGAWSSGRPIARTSRSRRNPRRPVPRGTDPA